MKLHLGEEIMELLQDYIVETERWL